ncbi:hypothetical protein AAVH_41802, partial [Aphelenchoides avenae]
MKLLPIIAVLALAVVAYSAPTGDKKMPLTGDDMSRPKRDDMHMKPKRETGEKTMPKRDTEKMEGEKKDLDGDMNMKPKRDTEHTKPKRETGEKTMPTLDGDMNRPKRDDMHMKPKRDTEKMEDEKKDLDGNMNMKPK